MLFAFLDFLGCKDLLFSMAEYGLDIDHCTHSCIKLVNFHGISAKIVHRVLTLLSAECDFDMKKIVKVKFLKGDGTYSKTV